MKSGIPNRWGCSTGLRVGFPNQEGPRGAPRVWSPVWAQQSLPGDPPRAHPKLKVSSTGRTWLRPGGLIILSQGSQLRTLAPHVTSGKASAKCPAFCVCGRGGGVGVGVGYRDKEAGSSKEQFAAAQNSVLVNSAQLTNTSSRASASSPFTAAPPATQVQPHT